MNKLKMTNVLNISADTEFEYFLKSSSGDIVPLVPPFGLEFGEDFRRKEFYEYIVQFILPTHFPGSEETFSVYSVKRTDLLDPQEATLTGDALLEEIRRLVEAQ